MGYAHGKLANFANIARNCGVDAKTVREYYQILVDTLLGTWVRPFKKRQDRHVILKAHKFYPFDVGVAGALAGTRWPTCRGSRVSSRPPRAVQFAPGSSPGNPHDEVFGRNSTGRRRWFQRDTRAVTE
jgi:hypothetical protein